MNFPALNGVIISTYIVTDSRGDYRNGGFDGALKSDFCKHYGRMDKSRLTSALKADMFICSTGEEILSKIKMKMCLLRKSLEEGVSD